MNTSYVGGSQTNHTPLAGGHAPNQELVKKELPSISSSPSLEAGPVRIDVPTASEHAIQHEELPMREAVEHSIQDAHVAAFVQVKPENIKLSPELKNVGLKPVNQTNFPAYQNVKIPISDEAVLEGERMPVNTSFRWLAEYAKWLLWRARISIKKIGGRVVRVISR